MIESRREERKILQNFCEWFSISHPDFSVSFSWKEVKSSLTEYLADNKLDLGELDQYQNRFPLKILLDKECGMTWDDYRLQNRNEESEIANYIRDEFCGIGSRMVKIKLNKLSENSIDAKILRLIFEVEDITASSFHYFGNYLERNLRRRDIALLELLVISKKFPEKLRIGICSDNIVICDINPDANNLEQFSWILNKNEEILNKIEKTDRPFILNLEPKFKRLEALIKIKMR